MENLLVLVLLFSMQDPAFREKLSSFLSFYRENRDVLTSIAKNVAPMSADTPSKPDGAATENRPREEVGDLKVLEEYLRRISEKS